MAEIIVIAHNIRSTYNVGSLFRTADGFGVTRLILTGYTPYPSHLASIGTRGALADIGARVLGNCRGSTERRVPCNGSMTPGGRRKRATP